MARNPGGSAARSPSALRGRGLVLAIVVVVAAAILGGVVGGVIVRETWPPSNGSSATTTAGSGDGETADATIVGRDPLTDLAVIRAQSASDLPSITLGKSDALQVGQPVVALGSPLGLTSTVTTGIVSALNRYVQVPSENGQSAHLVGAIQTDASINPGNSGGALVDCQARLVGINTAGAAVSNAGGGGSIGLGFAIPIDFARGIADELISAGRVTRPGFGMQVQPISSELAQSTGGTPGLFVQTVTAGGPASQAGLRPGDVITEVDGEPANSIDALVVKTLSMKPGDVVNLAFVRQGTSHTAALTLS